MCPGRQAGSEDVHGVQGACEAQWRVFQRYCKNADLKLEFMVLIFYLF